ncbi:MAG: RHS repeat-associated core domain-containing protein [Litorimonas sp.]
MLTLSDIANGFDPATGGLSLNVILAALPDAVGPSFSLAATYSSILGDVATTTNMTAPTGWMGLGWNLALPSIFVSTDANSLSVGRRYYLTRGQSLTELIPLRTANGITEFATFSADFWVIRYNAAAQSWTITDEDGTQWVYGDAQPAIETAIGWGHWSGASNQVQGQTAQAVGWRLSRIIDLWGRSVQFSYAQTTGTVGAGEAVFTRAIRLTRIVGAEGGRIDLDYEDKNPDEYVPAHQTPPPPNAWQDRYDTKALKSVTVSAAGGAVLDVVEFSYAFIGAQSLTKRILTRIQPAPPSGARPPALALTYQNSAGIDYGRLTEVTTPLGGVVQVSYTSQTPAFSNRSIAVTPPAGTSYDAPQLAFADDFTVAAWPASDDSKVALGALAWDGRWIAADLETLASSTAAPAVSIKVAKAAFAAQTQSEMRAWRRDLRLSGAWTASTKTTLDLGSPSSTEFACIDTAAVVLGIDTAKLQALTWTGSAWTAPDILSLSGASSKPVCGLGGAGDDIVAIVADADDSSLGFTMHRFNVDAFGQWTQTSNTIPRASGTLSAISVTSGIGFAVITAVASGGGKTRVQYVIVDWSDIAAPIRTFPLAQLYFDPSDAIPQPVVHGASVALGELLARYDGRAWTLQSIESDVPTGAAALQSISFAPDQVVRVYAAASGGLVADIVTYDPDATDTALWSQVASSTTPAGDFTAHVALARDTVSRYALLPHVTPGAGEDTAANAVFYQGPDMVWMFASEIPDTLSATDLPSLQLVGDRYVVYQSGAKTYAYPLKNGALDASYRTEISGTLLIDGQPTDSLIGPTSFATYSGDWTSGPTVTLHRATASGADGLAPTVVVEKIRRLPGNTTDLLTGYAVIDSVPTYETASAILAPSGTNATFNRVSVTEQSGAGAGAGTIQYEVFNALTTNESQSLPAAKRPDYPSNASADPSGYTRLLAGQTYRRTPKWTDETGTARRDVYAWVVKVTERHFLSGAYDPVGFYPRAVQSDSTMDGVSAQMIMQYSDATGFPTQTTGSQFDGDGQVQTLETDITYFPDIYAQDAPENLLSPIVQTISKSNGTSISAEATIWSSDWGTQAVNWAPQAGFVATAANFAEFDAWTNGLTPQGWQRESLTMARNTQSGVTLAKDVLNRMSTNLYDSGQARIVARFGVTAPNEASYYGFEPYERSGPWSYQGSASIRGHIVSTQYYTGSCALEIAASAPASPEGPAASFSNLGNRSYLFSCWMLPATGFVPDAAKTLWTLQAYSEGATPQPIGDPVTLEFPAPSTEKWGYLEAVIDLPKIRQAASLAADTPLTVAVTGINAVENGSSIYVDNLRFSPLGGGFSAVVFDPKTWLPRAQLGENGDTQRAVRNAGYRTISTIGPRDNHVGLITAMAFARSLSGADDAFNPYLPNQLLQVRSSSFGGYQDFDPSDVADWTLAAGWSIADRQLKFSGSSTDPIGARAELKGFTQSNYAARIQVSVDNPLVATISIGTGDVFVSWTPDEGGKWLLRRSDGSVWTTLADRAGILGADWLFAIVDEVVFFFADGNQIFGELLTTASQGKLVLGATASSAFEDLVIAKDPELLMTFMDGEGQPIQSMAMVDRQTVHVTGILFDDLGRATIEREPVRQTVAIGDGSGGQSPALAARTEGALTTYLPYEQNGDQMTIAEYLDPAVSGAPFNQTRLEASPMARPVELAGPGLNHALGSGHTVRIVYGANTASSWLDQVLATSAPGRAADSYSLKSVTDPNGNVVQTAANQSGQTIAEAFFPSGASSPTRIESYRYDGSGNLIETRLPNYYVPPLDADDGEPWKRSARYDFRGNLTATDGPDEGETQFMHDAANRVRFSMDAAGAALAPPSIRYVLYDDLDRVIERGLLQKAGVDWSSLAAHVDDPVWPSSADGAVWSRQYRYDRPADATRQAPNQVGRLIEAMFNRSTNASPSAAQIDVETYAYDVSGNVTSQNTLVPGFDSATRQTSYDFDNLGRIIKVVFPRTLDSSGQPEGTAVDATYFYDRLGRLAAVGEGADGTEVLDPENPNPGPKARYARNEFNERGLLTTTTFGMNSGGPIARSFAYDVTGRPTTIGGDFVNQTLTYGTGGLGHDSDWNGRVGSSAVSYTRQKGRPEDLASGLIETPRTWSYGYNAEGWLSGAVASDEAVHSALSTGTADHPITYDANGTLLSVPRLPATETYDYADPGTGKRSADKIVRLSTAVAQTIDLSGGILPTGWVLSSSNAGPVISHVATGQTGNVADYVELAGGTVNYYEALTYSGAFGMEQTYTLSFQWKSATDFAAETGTAALYATLFDARGQAYRGILMDLSAGAQDWTVGSQAIDLKGLSQTLGVAPAEIVSVSLEFINAKRGDSGQAGASLMIGDLALATGAVVPTSLSYDPSGRLTANAQRRLSTIGYDSESGRVSSLTMTADAPLTTADYQYGLSEDLSLATAVRKDGTVDNALYIRTPDGRLLATYAKVGDGDPQVVFEVPGNGAPVALLPSAGADPAQYFLRDHQGSVRAIAEEGAGPNAGLRATFDYGPFGELISSTGHSSSARRFTDQRLDKASGLTQFSSRSYDPRLRAFVSTDAAHESAWPYAYVAGDPINRVDPSGDLSITLITLAAAGLGAVGHVGWNWFNADDSKSYMSTDNVRAIAVDAAKGALVAAPVPIFTIFGMAWGPAGVILSLRNGASYGAGLGVAFEAMDRWVDGGDFTLDRAADAAFSGALSGGAFYSSFALGGAMFGRTFRLMDIYGNGVPEAVRVSPQMHELSLRAFIRHFWDDRADYGVWRDALTHTFRRVGIIGHEEIQYSMTLRSGLIKTTFKTLWDRTPVDLDHTIPQRLWRFVGHGWPYAHGLNNLVVMPPSLNQYWLEARFMPHAYYLQKIGANTIRVFWVSGMIAAQNAGTGLAAYGSYNWLANSTETGRQEL